MRKLILLSIVLVCVCYGAFAQSQNIFNTTMFNKEFDIYIVINAYGKNVTIPGQDFMGEMSGYLGDYQYSRKWFILESKEITSNSLMLQICNDEGSEDLEASLTCDNDSTFTLKQLKGSTLKIVRNRKWKKLPSTIVFTKKKK